MTKNYPVATIAFFDEASNIKPLEEINNAKAKASNQQLDAQASQAILPKASARYAGIYGRGLRRTAKCARPQAKCVAKTRTKREAKRERGEWWSSPAGL